VVKKANADFGMRNAECGMKKSCGLRVASCELIDEEIKFLTWSDKSVKCDTDSYPVLPMGPIIAKLLQNYIAIEGDD
jgi:hypothetical protein